MELLMAGIEDLKKGMSKIADDEYYASLQKFIVNQNIKFLIHMVKELNQLEEVNRQHGKEKKVSQNLADLIKKALHLIEQLILDQN